MIKSNQNLTVEIMEMETIVPDNMKAEYSVARGHMNTIRRFSDKYTCMRPGTGVKMRYFTEGDSEPYLIEFLTVRSVAMGKLKNIIEVHGALNHALYIQSSTDLLSLEKDIRRIYNDHTNDRVYLAIYF